MTCSRYFSGQLPTNKITIRSPLDHANLPQKNIYDITVTVIARCPSRLASTHLLSTAVTTSDQRSVTLLPNLSRHVSILAVFVVICSTTYHRTTVKHKASTVIPQYLSTPNRPFYRIHWLITNENAVYRRFFTTKASADVPLQNSPCRPQLTIKGKSPTATSSPQRPALY